MCVGFALDSGRASERTGWLWKGAGGGCGGGGFSPCLEAAGQEFMRPVMLLCSAKLVRVGGCMNLHHTCILYILLYYYINIYKTSVCFVCLLVYSTLGRGNGDGPFFGAEKSLVHGPTARAPGFNLRPALDPKPCGNADNPKEQPRGTDTHVQEVLPTQQPPPSPPLSSALIRDALSPVSDA